MERGHIARHHVLCGRDAHAPGTATHRTHNAHQNITQGGQKQVNKFSDFQNSFLRAGSVWCTIVYDRKNISGLQKRGKKMGILAQIRSSGRTENSTESERRKAGWDFANACPTPFLNYLGKKSCSMVTSRICRLSGSKMRILI
jgi:hypothetical protein